MDGKYLSLKSFILVLILILGTFSACSPTLKLNEFINNLQDQMRSTTPIVRLSIEQIIEGAGDSLIKQEQNIQCSSDPVIVELNGQILFDLKGSVKGSGILGMKSPSLKIAGESVHIIKYNATPVALSDIGDVEFDEDLGTIQVISNIEKTISNSSSKKTNPIALSTVPSNQARVQGILGKYLDFAWNRREQFRKHALKLIKEWKRPHLCINKHNTP